MNKTEADFAQHLELRKVAGELIYWDFEPIRFRLGDGAWYKPDFMVVDNQYLQTIFEVKGRWMEAARVRIKVAAERYWMYRFIAVKRDRKAGWVYEEL